MSLKSKAAIEKIFQEKTLYAQADISSPDLCEWGDCIAVGQAICIDGGWTAH